MSKENFLNAVYNLTDKSNMIMTENGANAYASTKTALYDFFALGSAYRRRSEEDIINLFKPAFEENPSYALKALFYLRDIRGGQGERRVFTTCLNWLGKNYPEVVIKNFDNIVEMGRWDDFYALVDTPLESTMFEFLEHQLVADLQTDYPSLCAKWIKSANASAVKTKALAVKTREAFELTPAEYRKMLSHLRKKINILETKMSANQWDEIELDKVPSQAFMRHVLAMQRHIPEKYQAFVNNKDVKMNMGAAYPYECVDLVLKHGEMQLADKAWENLMLIYSQDVDFDGLAVVDTSGSMYSKRRDSAINVALSLGLYCAEHARGVYKDKFITFSYNPELVHTQGDSFSNKIQNMKMETWGFNTNIEKTFDVLLNAAVETHAAQSDIPKNLVIISDMEFDMATSSCVDNRSVLEEARLRWEAAGYTMPHLIFWNVDARQDNFPMKDEDGITFVSGCSPVIFNALMTGKSGQDIMYEMLNTGRYSSVTV